MTTYSIRMTRFIYMLKLIVHITLVYKNLYNFEDMLGWFLFLRWRFNRCRFVVA